MVAEEVRKLAEESARAAKDVADTIAVVRENIEAAVMAMAQGERDVQNVGTIANEADDALGTMLTGVRRLAEVVSETALVSRTQSATMSELTTTMTDVRAISLDASQRAGVASDAASHQTRALDGLTLTSKQLADLADRLRQSISRFSVTEADVTPAPQSEAPGARPSPPAALQPTAWPALATGDAAAATR